MDRLSRYFRDKGGQFGNPEIHRLKEAFDLTWNCEHKIALRWSWLDPYGLRRDPEEDSLMFCALVWDYEFHLELKEKSHSFLYVNHRLIDFPGKIRGAYPYPNEIVKCLTPEGEWVKKALKEGLDYLEKLG